MSVGREVVKMSYWIVGKAFLCSKRGKSVCQDSGRTLAFEKLAANQPRITFRIMKGHQQTIRGNEDKKIWT